MFFGSVVGVHAQDHTVYSNRKALMTVHEAGLGNPREELKTNTEHCPQSVSSQPARNAMLTPATNTDAPNREEVPAPQWLLTTELDFYEAYAWCLDPYPTVQDAIKHLRTEIDRLQIVLNVWQTGEVATNIFLLSCGLLNAVEEYLRGTNPVDAEATGRDTSWAWRQMGD